MVLCKAVLSLILVLFSALLPAANVHALADPVSEAEFPSLEAFIQQVRNGDAGDLRGVYIPGILAAPIVQQSGGMQDFISPWQNVVTQFSLASRLGSTGLLAHNYLAGETFAFLEKGQEIHLVHGDGGLSTFTVKEILRYQVLNAGSASGSFLNLETRATIGSSSLFTKIYNRPGGVVFQTCIEAGDDLSWGRLFVIAEPVQR